MPAEVLERLSHFVQARMGVDRHGDVNGAVPHDLLDGCGPFQQAPNLTIRPTTVDGDHEESGDRPNNVQTSQLLLCYQPKACGKDHDELPGWRRAFSELPVVRRRGVNYVRRQLPTRS